MEYLLIGIGGIALIIMVVAGLLAIGVLATMWESWWLHPLWAVVMVPLGAPPITFWHFLALNVFLSVLLIPNPEQDHAKEADDTKRKTATVMRVVLMFGRPVIAYYLIRWAVS